MTATPARGRVGLRIPLTRPGDIRLEPANMSTHIPAVVFTLDRNSPYTDELYGGALYALLDKASRHQQDHDFRCYSFRHEAHIQALLALCAAEHLHGLDFIGQALAVMDDHQLETAHASLQRIIRLIETALEQSDLARLRPLTDACGFQPHAALSPRVVRHAFEQVGNLRDVCPLNTGGDAAENVLAALFDYIRSLHDVVDNCIREQRVLVYFHHPA
ncbi:tRNA-dependent cyclodipeptide synthase [Marinobacterium weihaiense]|uniref:tRNA-dependent cyclodipeptide synthase n=1 Tax=Marinobacterium weihaiense TaxID=2851016 RepID=A0ABS6MBJ9_9GAMM|nr:tRNA-dependent cyclodipeptide synthase [Marinobacterium weihaiense]MBV0933663.1 tRNA-dependent cyclodipeptide synthase [Marinobacterium weihaiense]